MGRPEILPRLARALLLALPAYVLAACSTLASEARAGTPDSGAVAGAYLDRLPQDEMVYFVLPDRFENGDPSNDTGGIPGGVLDHGFDPEAKGFYHGGDLAGLTSRLDYIQNLGMTAIWLGPIYQNKAVQGPAGMESAGYHGYWITDFTRVDRHLGTEADMLAFAEAVHARGMKLYLDIITNHTADVIQYRECADPAWPDYQADGCPYRPIADYPYTTRGGLGGEPINDGFMGHFPPFQTADNFARLTDMTYAYTPFIPQGEERVKVPAWLNDIRYYHNRGNTTFEGESSTMGDFVGLDDLMTEHPDVVGGMIDIYRDWITRYRLDGFRIDTAKHVNMEFWLAFNPAMLEHAESIGIPNFTIFGEAMHEGDSPRIAVYTHEGAFPAMLDFGFQDIVRRVLVEGEPSYVLNRFFAVDALYKGDAAIQSPTFIGNHDIGRFSGLLKAAHPGMDPDEALERVKLAHAMMFLARGVPTIYYGDEQGFVSSGNDQLAREDMMPSRVSVYNEADLLGTNATTADSNFDETHPLYLAIRELALLRTAQPALRRGRQIERLAEEDGGVYAFSRLGETGGELLVVLNLRREPRDVAIPVDARSSSFQALLGSCPASTATTGVLALSLAPLSYTVCKSQDWKD